jgi:hypothetical protein
MRVLIVGLPYFTGKLHKELTEFDPGGTYYRLDTYYSRKDRLKSLFLLPRVDVVYSINGALDKSRLFDLAFRWKKKVMMTWVGTDVTKARKLSEINALYLEKAHHYCEVDWIQRELKEHLRIDAKILNFFNFPAIPPMHQPEGKELKILTYISKNREQYYGWHPIMEAARQHPEVKFTVVGTDGIGEWPGNVSCLGWVENMSSLFEAHHATIRFVEHDGLSGFVLESLCRGKQVLYSEPLVHCHPVKDAADIARVLGVLKGELEHGNSLLNEEGVKFVNENFSRSKILSELIDEMKK